MKQLFENWRKYMNESISGPFYVVKRPNKIRGKAHYTVVHKPSDTYVDSALYKMGRKAVQAIADKLNLANQENEGIFENPNLPNDEKALRKVIEVIKSAPERSEHTTISESIDFDKNWLNFLSEKKWADYEFEKDSWEELSPAEIEAARDPVEVDIPEEFIDLINKAYEKIGGNFDYKTPEDIPGDADIWIGTDIDDDPEPDALRIAKTKPAGVKLSASGHDGTRAGIDAYKAKTAEMLKKPGHYAEMSKGIAHVMLKYHGIRHVDDPEVVQATLGPSKPIKWLGAHPEGKYPGIEGWYTRTISGNEDELKIMLGDPRP